VNAVAVVVPFWASLPALINWFRAWAAALAEAVSFRVGNSGVTPSAWVAEVSVGPEREPRSPRAAVPPRKARTSLSAVTSNGEPVALPLSSRAWRVSIAQSSSSAGMLKVISPFTSAVTVRGVPGAIARFPDGVQAPTGRSVLMVTCAAGTAVPLESVTTPCTL